MTMRSARFSKAATNASSGPAASPGAAGWLSLAAAPAFATMALLTATLGAGPADILCSVAHGTSPIDGMVTMYVLMSAFHAAPWLRLIDARFSR